MTPSHKPRFQFGLQSLFGLVAVVAVASGIAARETYLSLVIGGLALGSLYVVILGYLGIGDGWRGVLRVLGIENNHQSPAALSTNPARARASYLLLLCAVGLLLLVMPAVLMRGRYLLLILPLAIALLWKVRNHVRN